MSIEAKDLTFIYNQGTAFEKRALHNINFTINEGEFIGIIGHTGSGKSTLIQQFNALLKPTKGQMILDGVDINEDKTKLKMARQKVGLVFQYPEHQLFETTVKKDVAYGPKNMGLSLDEIDRRVEKALEIVGISRDLHEKSPFQLSGGEKRRVAIAGVLAMEPKVLILDEPTAGLDPRGRDDILEKIRLMHKSLKITIILVSHSMEDIARLSDRVMVMHMGEIALFATPQEVFSKTEELEAMGLSSPQTSYLMAKLRSKGFDVPDGVFTADDATKAIYKILKQV